MLGWCQDQVVGHSTDLREGRKASVSHSGVVQRRRCVVANASAEALGLERVSEVSQSLSLRGHGELQLGQPHP